MSNEQEIIKKLSNTILNTDNPLRLPFEKAEFFPKKDVIINAFSTIKKILFVHTAKILGKNLEQEQALLCSSLESAIANLRREVKNTFCLLCANGKDCAACEAKARKITDEFLDYLPQIQQLAFTDITAAYNGDPAAKNNFEVLLCYPGPEAVCYQRMAHFFYKKDIVLIARMLTEYAHGITGIDIHPGAKIGPYFFIDHGTGVVIGETTTIGRNVKLYQGVTLGARSFPLDANGNPQKGIKRHPDVEDNVTIYAGATILGNIRIGTGSVIAANTWITNDIPPNTHCK